MKVLVIEDNQSVVKDLNFCLKVRYPDFVLVDVAGGLKGIDLVEAESPDLLFVDSSLPDIDTLDLISKVREFSDIPLIVLSETDGEMDRAKGLEAGADEYVDKPIRPLELLARVNALLRRTQKTGFESEHTVSINDNITINFASHEVFAAGQRVNLTPTEYRLLSELARNAGKVVSCETLLNKVWGPEYEADRSFVKKYIYRLRSKLRFCDTSRSAVVSERGIGYRLTNRTIRQAGP
jgi:two-component system, OmpR family, KDP operon response regulator KdpE